MDNQNINQTSNPEHSAEAIQTDNDPVSSASNGAEHQPIALTELALRAMFLIGP